MGVSALKQAPTRIKFDMDECKSTFKMNELETSERIRGVIFECIINYNLLCKSLEILHMLFKILIKSKRQLIRRYKKLISRN